MTRNGSLNWWLLAFLFWASFLLVLEPGNLARAAALGRDLTFTREFLRISCATLIGMAAMPAVLYLEHRYPVQNLSHYRNAAWLVAGLLAVAGAMNLVSCLAFTWRFEQQWLPSSAAIRRQLAANWALLAFALIGLVAIVRVIRSIPVPHRAALKEVIVKSGTRSVRVALEDVEWIEAQGNYVALHVGARTHLLRKTLTALAAELDGTRFVRIHRSTAVRIDRIVKLRTEVNGEATVTLSTGRELRVSKGYRRDVRTKWATDSSTAPI
ncbi:MAG: LytTR family DNA-binding domain-containing protein [Pseudomonadota bacterium]